MLDLLKEKRAEIVGAWERATLGTYPAGAASFFERENDPFANPVGASVRASIGPLFDALVSDAAPEEYAPHLDGLIRVRCVQGFPASWTVSFVFLLKGVIRRSLSDRTADAQSLAALMSFEARIDRMAARAFDIYVEHVRKIADIRVREMKDSVAALMRMSRLGDSGPGRNLPNPTAEGGEDAGTPDNIGGSYSAVSAVSAVERVLQQAPGNRKAGDR
ncbi:MAG: RsbRD N-terminal domain-containing protein [Deltaproteobacteria bacterium]|nr:RsbRD N-terminal domain-containing protein [Deltaproteobacteria bacterium]